MEIRNPKLPEDTVLILRDEKYLYLCPSRPDWVVVNKNTAIALSLCDGTRTLDQIGSELEQAHPNSKEAVDIIRKLQDRGFLSDISIKIIGDKKPNLKSLHLNLSRSCNLACNYCYAEERPLEGQQLSLEEYKHLLDDVRSMSNYVEVALTGGEPLLNKDAGKIAEYCREIGFYTHLLTNAIPINERNAEYLAKTFDVIRISIDGTTPEYHDFHRGVGTLHKTTKAVDLLLAHGAKVKIAMTVTKHNIDNIQEMAKKYGEILTFQPLFDAGNAKEEEGLDITGMEYFDALKDSKNIAVMGGVEKHIQKMRNSGTTKCVIGDGEISIGHNGDVYSCHMVHLPEFLAGNIRDVKLSEIYRSSPVLQKSRELHIDARPECAECLVRLFCGGSCRARALYLAGDINACDDFCDYELSAFIDALFNTTLATLEDIESFNSQNASTCGDSCASCS